MRRREYAAPLTQDFWRHGSLFPYTNENSVVTLTTSPAIGSMGSQAYLEGAKWL